MSEFGSASTVRLNLAAIALLPILCVTLWNGFRKRPTISTVVVFAVGLLVIVLGTLCPMLAMWCSFSVE